jgi:transposase-like protein
VLRCIQRSRRDTQLTKRRSFSDKFKATVALEALRGDKTAQEIAAKHKIHPTQVTTWKRQAIDGLTGVFSDKVRKAEEQRSRGERSACEDRETGGRKRFFVTRAEAMSPSERKSMIRKGHSTLSLTRQCRLLKISRSSLYYTPVVTCPPVVPQS